MKNLKNVMGAVLIIFGVLCILGDLNVITFNVEKYFQTELVVPVCRLRIMDSNPYFDDELLGFS